ncbi:MAG TPA: hypothetical protein VH817_22345 [Thermoleophilaceae bacterium]
MTSRARDDAGPEGALAEAPRPDNVLALAIPVWVETSVARPAGEGNVSGFAIALGWNTPQRSSAYLISDDAIVRPVWVAESELVSNSVRRR